MDREAIKNRFGGRCAYCGKILGTRFHVDHVKPLFRGWQKKPAGAGDNAEENLFPACPRCNLRKMDLSVEQFRQEIMAQVARLRKNVRAFTLAEDFGIVTETGKEVEFWFEAASRSNGVANNNFDTDSQARGSN